MQKKSKSSRSIDRAVTLLALICVSAFEYGLRIVMLCAAAVVAAMAAELLGLYLRKIPFRLKHLDAAVCGILLVLMMPPTVSVSLVIMSVIFAIIIGRQLFGGRENPVIAPAAAGYCFAILNNRQQMTMFPAEKGILPLLDMSGVKLTEGVSVLWNRTGDFSDSVQNWIAGLPSQPIGTGSLLLLLMIALVLMLRRSASFWVLVPMMGMLFAGDLALGGFRAPASAFAGCCLTNQTLFAAIFLFSDPDYAPPHAGGVLYGLLCGLAVMTFTRIFNVYDAPILLAVIASPLALWLRHMLRREAAPVEGGDTADAS